MKLNSDVDVISVSDSVKRSTRPIRIKWYNRVYPVTDIASHTSIVDRAILYHTFYVISKSTYFVLRLNTKTLQWTIEEMTDIEAAA